MKECIFQEIKTAAGKKFLVSDSAIDSNERQCAYVYACVRAFKESEEREPKATFPNERKFHGCEWVKRTNYQWNKF